MSGKKDKQGPGNKVPGYVSKSPEHGGFSFPRMASLDNDGDSTIIGEGRVPALIPEDDVWYKQFQD